MKPVSLVMFSDFSRGFAPWAFRDWLPKVWRRGLQSDSCVVQFLAAWNSAWEAVRGQGVRLGFEESLELLQGARSDIESVVVHPNGAWVSWSLPATLWADLGYFEP